MGLIIFLVVLGAFFLVAELVFLPGAVLGSLLALSSYGVAVFFGFSRFGLVGGITTIVAVLLLSLVVTVLSMRAKTWQRLALKDKVSGASMESPSQSVAVGDKGVAISRLSPMGKVEIGGKLYEAKSQSVYIDQQSEVEVVGFENFTVLVKKL